MGSVLCHFPPSVDIMSNRAHLECFVLSLIYSLLLLLLVDSANNPNKSQHLNQTIQTFRRVCMFTSIAAAGRRLQMAKKKKKEIQLVLSAFELFSIGKWKSIYIRWEGIFQFCVQWKFVGCSVNFPSKARMNREKCFVSSNQPTDDFRMDRKCFWNFHCTKIGLCYFCACHRILIFVNRLNADFFLPHLRANTHRIVHDTYICGNDCLLCDTICKFLTLTLANGQWIDNKFDL